MFKVEREQEIIEKVYPIDEMLGKLVHLTENQWGIYAFYHEPLERKFTKEQKIKYIQKAYQCGQEEAKLLKEQYPNKTIEEIIMENGFCLHTSDEPIGGEYVVLAQYTEPNEILIYSDCVKKAEVLIKENQLEQYLKNLQIKELLMAHELFHGIEYQKKKSIYTQTEKIELWRKPFSNKSKIVCLSEIGAMAFAKELLQIPFSPYVMDVLLMFCYQEEMASLLYEEILEATGIQGIEESGVL